ncbi:hypothetical protein Aph01nite_42780 [Acrocarpospora phusangensis]|uniref:HTH cro/C1-type domain-containing protein n=2 Tax=Acrocarpospora phusangensis TaxID=1070424 RepID=A0A919UQ24_9ACTN|nr:hypothetical protein Aph01nite_42780 [Acrocarpospora phusangensis]
MVSRWENGKRYPTFWLPHLATALGVNVSVLESGQLKRRTFVVSAAIGALGPLVPARNRDSAVEITSSIAGGDAGVLATVQTSHETDLLISQFTAGDAGSERLLMRWLEEGPAVLRVNACGIVAKTGRPELVDSATHALRRDQEVRELYLNAVGDRVGTSPQALIKELYNPRDAGARWCSAVLLREHPAEATTSALRAALRSEPVSENIRTIGMILNGVDPCI